MNHKIKIRPSKFCPGCGHQLTLLALEQALTELKIKKQTVLGLDIGCSLLAWDFLDIDTVQTHHGRTIPTMIGFKMASPRNIALAYLGDGGAYAIGLSHLIHAALRNDPITVIVINNLNYAMTGGQASPTTLSDQRTKTLLVNNQQILLGPELAKKANPKICAWRALATEPGKLKECLLAAINQQKQNHSFSLIEVLSPCPTNWRLSGDRLVQFWQKIRTSFSMGEIK